MTSQDNPQNAPDSPQNPPAEGSRGFLRAMGLFPATTLNMSQMVGIGPFITIPLIISAIGGPQVMLGWIIGALIALCDGLVWAELGASMPRAGGTYTFLREAFQYSTGKFMPFMFVWSTLLVTPLIMATGMIGMTDYLGYFWHMSSMQAHWIAVGFTVLTVALLYRRIDSIAKLTKILWAGMIITVVLYLVACYSHFSPHLAFTFPAGAFDAGKGVFWTGLGAALTLAIYDYLGYYTVAYLGDEVRNPGRVIPRSIIISVIAVMVIDLSMNIGTIGIIPWQQAEKSTSIGSDLLHHIWGGAGATAITILIIWTAFASVFTGLLGASRLPFSAARERLFFSPFGRLHPRLRFPHISLLVMGLVTAIASFFPLTTVINALIALVIWVQFIGQIAALTILRRKQPGLRRPYRQWLYPVPSVLALVGWVYIFQASGWSAIRIMLAWTAAGIIAFLIWARFEHAWPFGPKQIHEDFAGAPLELVSPVRVEGRLSLRAGRLPGYSRLMQTITGPRAAVRKLAMIAGAGLCVGCIPAVLAGSSASAQRASGGTVEHWGRSQLSPAAVHLPGPVAEVGTSNTTAYALLADGSVYAWGVGNHGQLGNGSTKNSAVPVRVRFPGRVRIASIPADAMPWDAAYAIDTTGHVWAWGADAGGEFCLGNTQSHETPVRLPLSHVTAVAGASEHTTYDAGGTLYSCGGNAAGELGDGSTRPSQVPVKVRGLNGTSVAALVTGFRDVGALLANGQYYDWGWNGGGQLGDGTTGGFADRPVQVQLPAAVTQAAQGGNDPEDGQTLVLLSDGSVYAWGTNESGQLGTGNHIPASSPVRISPPAGVTYTDVASGGNASYAISAAGNVYAWGGNKHGQLGDGSKTSSRTPVKVESHAISPISATSYEVAVSVRG